MTTQAEMITTVEQELKGLSEYLETVDYTNAATDAANDTGWAFPVSAGFQTYWQKQRLKRHLYEYLRSYDGVGNDTTYDSDNQVNFDPGENA